jgi:hypothetical protein
LRWSVIKLSTAIALAIVLTNAVHNAHAQDWPRRAVTMIVPFAAGGPSDAQGRILALHLSDFLHQSVIVENVVGAGGMAGSARVPRPMVINYCSAGRTLTSTTKHFTASRSTMLWLILRPWPWWRARHMYSSRARTYRSLRSRNSFPTCAQIRRRCNLALPAPVQLLIFPA